MSSIISLNCSVFPCTNDCHVLDHFQKSPLSFNFYVFFENEGLLTTWGVRVSLLGIKGVLCVFIPLVCSTVYEGAAAGHASLVRGCERASVGYMRSGGDLEGRGRHHQIACKHETRQQAMVAQCGSMFGSYESYSYRLWSLANVWTGCQCKFIHHHSTHPSLQFD